ncbi:SulP family inorganic anion transporter [Baaleninema sp.]|uniref:SulP family inorganic anion transporter n=1 Tax=Baaleninema sp. TaxID=3101197 RepID=UPI003D077917
MTFAIRKNWFSNLPADLLAGAVVALALIPEAIAFSIIAGVDPKVGLYASFTMAVTIAFFGGRPGMVSATTGAMALLMVTLVRDHGVEYLLATTILTGILQIGWGLLRIGKYMRFISKAVMVGFVNALAILIFDAQLPQLIDVPWVVYPMVLGGLAIIYILPRFTKVVPSPLVAIVTLTVIAIAAGVEVPTVGDMGELPTRLPTFGVPQVPFNWETLKTVFPYALPLSMVGLLESFLTASVVDELTDTSSDKNREAKGQGIANIVTGLFGGMAGCAMIGQSVINVKSGGRTRLSTLSAGVFLLFFILGLGTWVQQIPMAALVAVMIMVSIGTFSWSSITHIHRVPRSETVTMLTTVVVTIATHNLAWGVLAGVSLSTIFFSQKIAQLVFIDSVLSPDENERMYSVAGQIFFVSVEQFRQAFDFKEDIDRVVINLSNAHLWDRSAVTAVDRVVLGFRRNGVEVKLMGLNEASATLLDKHAVFDKPESLQDLSSH